MKKVQCKGVGDNNGFFEATVISTKVILDSVDTCMQQAMTVCGRVGYSPAGISILIYLSKVGSARVTQIAEEVGVTQQAVGRQLNGMSDNGIVKMSKNYNDNRAKDVVLTAEGHRTVDRIVEAWR